MRRAADGSGSDLRDFASSFPAAFGRLEQSIHALVASGWDELRRRQAHEIASALSAGAKEAGWRETAGLLQAMASLLALPLGEVLSIREELRDKLIELLELLGQDPLAQTG